MQREGKPFVFSFVFSSPSGNGFDTSFEKGKCRRTSKPREPILYKNMRKIVLEFGRVVISVQDPRVFVPKSVQSIFHPASPRLLCRKDDVFPCRHLTDPVSRPACLSQPCSALLSSLPSPALPLRSRPPRPSRAVPPPAPSVRSCVVRSRVLPPPSSLVRKIQPAQEEASRTLGLCVRTGARGRSRLCPTTCFRQQNQCTVAATEAASGADLATINGVIFRRAGMQRDGRSTGLQAADCRLQ